MGDVEFVENKVNELSEKFAIVLDRETIRPQKKKETDSDRTKRHRRKKKSKEVCKYVRDKIYPNIDFSLNHNSKYHKNRFLDMLVHIAMTKDFTNNGSKTFSELESEETPSSDALLYHLKKYEDIEVIQDMFIRAFDIVWKMANKADVFTRRKVNVAIDGTVQRYYGDKNDPGVTEIQPKDGTSHGYKFLTINIVDGERRFTLLALPVKKFSDKTRIVRKLLKFAMKRININHVYMDRGFFNSSIINLMDELGLDFLMPGIKNPRVKKIAERTPAPIVVEDYKMKSSKFNLIVVEDEDNIKRVFTTNIRMNENDMDLAERLFKAYGRRWGIETSYRVTNNFRAKTTSKDYLVRLFYWLYSVLLYNIWIMIDILLAEELLGEKPEDHMITSKLFGTIFYSIASNLGVG